jgi:HSP20 family protein
MPHDIISRPFWDFPNMRLMSLWDDEDTTPAGAGNPGGLSISEDAHNVYVDAAIPGVEADDVEMTYHNNILKIHGKVQEEEKKDRKNYRMMTSEFSYQVAVRDVDPNQDPEATVKNGVLHVTFAKSKAAQPKKISVKK